MLIFCLTKLSKGPLSSLRKLGLLLIWVSVLEVLA
jgi:hypothetical protein